MGKMLSMNKGVNYKPLKKVASYRLNGKKEGPKTVKIPAQGPFKSKIWNENPELKTLIEEAAGLDGTRRIMEDRAKKDSSPWDAKAYEFDKAFMKENPVFAKAVRNAYKAKKRWERLPDAEKWTKEKAWGNVNEKKAKDLIDRHRQKIQDLPEGEYWLAYNDFTETLSRFGKLRREVREKELKKWVRNG